MLNDDMMKNNYSYFALLVLALALAACEQNIAPDFISKGEVSDIHISEDVYLTQITIEGQALDIEVFPTQDIVMKGAGMDVQRASMENPFTLETSISSPILDGATLSCSFVKVANVSGATMAYITYSRSGAVHGGALVVMDYSDIENPVLVNEVLFNDIDINICEIHHLGKRVWLGGSSNKTGAVVIPIELNDDGSIVLDNGAESVFDIVKIKGVASVNGIVEAGDWIMVTAGNSNGGTWAINFKKDYAFEGYDAFSNAKFSASNGYAMGRYHVSLEGGETAALHVYRAGVEDEDGEKVLPLGSIYHDVANANDQYSGKATCFMTDNSSICYVAMGANGFKTINIFSGDVVMQSLPSMLLNGNTNGITADKKYIYLANGADGVVICEVPPVIRGELASVKPLYLWDDGDNGASANFVVAYENLLFVAKGAQGGLKVIKTEID